MKIRDSQSPPTACPHETHPTFPCLVHSTTDWVWPWLWAANWNLELRELCHPGHGFRVLSGLGYKMLSGGPVLEHMITSGWRCFFEAVNHTKGAQLKWDHHLQNFQRQESGPRRALQTMRGPCGASHKPDNGRAQAGTSASSYVRRGYEWNAAHGCACTTCVSARAPHACL